MKKILQLVPVVVLIYLIIGIIKWNTTTIFASLISITLISITNILQKKTKIPNHLKLLIYIFILTAEVLGEIYHFYNKVWYFDIIIHTYSSFVISYIGYYIIKNTKINKKLIIIFILSFSMMCESLWEIFEFTTDRVLKTDMQKDTIITEITSTYLSNNNTPYTISVEEASLNNISLTDQYKGYIDIGLYDTISDMTCALLGALTFIIIIKKRL